MLLPAKQEIVHLNVKYLFINIHALNDSCADLWLDVKSCTVCVLYLFRDLFRTALSTHVLRTLYQCRPTCHPTEYESNFFTFVLFFTSASEVKKKSLPSLRPLDYRGKIIVLCNWHCQYYVTRTVKKNCIKVGVCVCVCVCQSHFFHTHPVLPPSAVWTGINDCTDRHKLISSNRQQQQWAKPSEDILWHARHHHHSLSANKASDNRRH